MEIFKLLARKPAAPKKIQSSDTPAQQPLFRGVQIKPSPDACCQAARDIASQRFLSTDAPLLPLADCDAANCACVYEHFEDRRTAVRRASDTGFDYAAQYCTDEKRKSLLGGRRTDD